MKKTSKIIVALCIILAVTMIAVTVFADGEGIKPSDFGNGNISAESTEGIKNFGGQMIGVVRTVGVLLVLGIKYMVGSAEDKADYKKSMIPYLVGAVLIFAASAITGIVYDMATALGKPE